MYNSSFIGYHKDTQYFLRRYYMKIMPVVFEVEKVERKHKNLIYELFSKICQDNNMVFLIKFSKTDSDGFIVFDKKNSEKVSVITRKVNESLSECNIDYMVALPMIMDGERFKRPTFYPDGKIRIIR